MSADLQRKNALPTGRHFCISSQSKFFAVFRVILIKAVRADFDEAVYIFMRIKAVRLKLNESNGYVRAVVGNSLEICQQIVEHKAVVERAYALLQAVDVVQLHLVAQVIYKLLKRLDAVCGLKVVAHEGVDGDGNTCSESKTPPLKKRWSFCLQGFSRVL